MVGCWLMYVGVQRRLHPASRTAALPAARTGNPIHPTQPAPLPPLPPLCSFMVLQRKDPEAAKALHELMDTDVSAVLCLLACCACCSGCRLCCNCIPACPIQPLPRPHSCLTLAQPTYHPPLGFVCRSSCATSGWWPCPRSRWWRARAREQMYYPYHPGQRTTKAPQQDPPPHPECHLRRFI